MPLKDTAELTPPFCPHNVSMAVVHTAFTPAAKCVINVRLILKRQHRGSNDCISPSMLQRCVENPDPGCKRLHFPESQNRRKETGENE